MRAEEIGPVWRGDGPVAVATLADGPAMAEAAAGSTPYVPVDHHSHDPDRARVDPGHARP